MIPQFDSNHSEIFQLLSLCICAISGKSINSKSLDIEKMQFISILSGLKNKVKDPSCEMNL